MEWRIHWRHQQKKGLHCQTTMEYSQNFHVLSPHKGFFHPIVITI